MAERNTHAYPCAYCSSGPRQEHAIDCFFHGKIAKPAPQPEPIPRAQVRVVICQGQNLSPESLKALMDMALKAFDSEGE